jgi:beta-carotene 15,15'-dioxygenase
MKYVLQLIGLGLYFLHKLAPLSTQNQFIIFLIGIVLLGIPHGAADMLIETENKRTTGFKITTFLISYLARLLFFAAILYYFPLIGNFLFILFAAYHFGETDLHQFKTENLSGKIFVSTYGLAIISIILLFHFEEVKPILFIFKSGIEYSKIISFIGLNNIKIISIVCTLFFIATFFYFSKNKHDNNIDTESFLIRFGYMCVLLFFMPLFLGFTFYFIIWHSSLSLSNIVYYLKLSKNTNTSTIVKQIFFYSSLAIIGIGISGCSAFYYFNNSAMSGYIFLGLAVLTAPHMGVMHTMYKNLRSKQYLKTI